MTEVGAAYLSDAAERFRKMKDTVERAIVQVDDAGLFASPNAEVNSIAVTMKHMAGNLRSRFTDFLSTDGEKPDRDRDGEFDAGSIRDRAALAEQWEAGWRVLLATLDELTSADLLTTVRIRGEPHTVVQAINRQLAHQSYHTGQVVQLAKSYAPGEWQTLSIPRKG